MEHFTFNSEQKKVKQKYTNSREFLQHYHRDIISLPAVSGGADFFRGLNPRQRDVFTTLLPLAAAFKKREPELKTDELIERIKFYCADKIGKVLANPLNFNG